MKMIDLLHKRILIAAKSNSYSSSSIVTEFTVLEVAPSGNFVKVRDMDGRRYWKISADIVPIEVLECVEKSPITVAKKTTWARHSLNTTQFRDGTPIPNINHPDDWCAMKSPAMCYYQNDNNMGVLYNWYAVSSVKGLAPDGWRVPTPNDFRLSGTPEINGTGVFRSGVDGNFHQLDDSDMWWTSHTYDASAAMYYMSNIDKGVITDIYDKSYGLSVRLVKVEE